MKNINNKTEKGVPTNVNDFVEKRNLNQQELQEYIEMVKLCNNQRWKTMLITGNTALIPDGLNMAKYESAVTNLLDNSRNNWISQLLVKCGVPSGQSIKIDSETGVIEYIKNIPVDIEKKEKRI